MELIRSCPERCHVRTVLEEETHNLHIPTERRAMQRSRPVVGRRCHVGAVPVLDSHPCDFQVPIKCSEAQWTPLVVRLGCRVSAALGEGAGNLLNEWVVCPMLYWLFFRSLARQTGKGPNNRDPG
jgi:hypothetical protein